MSDSTSTPKPAIAVTPEAATAAPVRVYVRRNASIAALPRNRSCR